MSMNHEFNYYYIEVVIAAPVITGDSILRYLREKPQLSKIKCYKINEISHSKEFICM
jgi:hypothetical protein